jgi:hypothetical protein
VGGGWGGGGGDWCGGDVIAIIRIV